MAKVRTPSTKPFYVTIRPYLTFHSEKKTMPLRLNSFAKSVMSRTRKRSQLRRSIRFESLEQRILLFNGPLMSDAGLFSGSSNEQVIYVNLEGARSVNYRGPIEIGGIAVPAFAAPSSFKNHEVTIKETILKSLNHDFEGSHVSFVATQPPAGIDFSTIFVGGDGSAFNEHGLYYGLAEQVDHGNRHHDDNAFVFSDLIPNGAKDAEDYGRDLAKVVSHEAGHLLGFEHAHEDPRSDDPLAPVAFKPYTHIEVAVDVRCDLLADGKVTIEGPEYRH